MPHPGTKVNKDRNFEGRLDREYKTIPVHSFYTINDTIIEQQLFVRNIFAKSG